MAHKYADIWDGHMESVQSLQLAQNVQGKQCFDYRGF